MISQNLSNFSDIIHVRHWVCLHLGRLYSPPKTLVYESPTRAYFTVCFRSTVQVKIKSRGRENICLASSPFVYTYIIVDIYFTAEFYNWNVLLVCCLKQMLENQKQFFKNYSKPRKDSSNTSTRLAKSMFRYWLRHVLVEISDSNQFQQRKAWQSIVFGKCVMKPRHTTVTKKKKLSKYVMKHPSSFLSIFLSSMLLLK